MTMGRPKIQIDWDQLDKLCHIQATKEEIVNFLEVSIDILDARIKEKHSVSFSTYYNQKASGGKMSLRRKQFTTATGGNVTMLIWLGKQYLDQADKKDLNIHEDYDFEPAKDDTVKS